MKKLDKKYPIYAFAKNKGYGTPYHLNALKEVGYTSFHRQSFKGVVV
jgi:ribonuclease HII